MLPRSDELSAHRDLAVQDNRQSTTPKSGCQRSSSASPPVAGSGDADHEPTEPGAGYSGGFAVPADRLELAVARQLQRLVERREGLDSCSVSKVIDHRRMD